MKKRLVFIISLVAFLGLFQSCDTIFDIATDIIGQDGSGTNTDNQGNLPYNEEQQIKNKVVERARYYVRQNTEYVSGGMGNRAIPFDCSGLVLRCYEEALQGTHYETPYPKRPTAAELQSDYSTPTNNPQPGDLVFFNFAGGNSKTNHVGIFVSLSNNRLTWIDASNHKEYVKVVDERTRTFSDLTSKSKFKGFGKMNLIRK